MLQHKRLHRRRILVADVRENEEAVLVLISMRNVNRGADCGGVIAVTLSEPLGERVLIDLYDWEPIDILGGESPNPFIRRGSGRQAF